MGYQGGPVAQSVRCRPRRCRPTQCPKPALNSWTLRSACDPGPAARTYTKPKVVFGGFFAEKREVAEVSVLATC